MRNNNKPEDVIINTFHFLTTGAVLPQDLTDIGLMVARFYNDSRPGSPGTLASVMTSGHMAVGTVHEARVFNMSLPAPRSPVASTFFELAGLNDLGALPAEVACVLSYKAAPFGEPAPERQRRGRLYFGPLNTGWLGNAAGGDARPFVNRTNYLRWAGRGLLEDKIGNPTWSVYSRVTGIARPVTSLSTDDAFDSQRRRGAAPTARTVYPLT
jgi:hypothetical protein